MICLRKSSNATWAVRDVICNTSPLQHLHQADLLHLLPALFGSVKVPSVVIAELAEGQRRGVRLPELVELPWATVRSVQDRKLLPLVTSLGDGEKEVLALGLETSGSLLLLDDRDARRHAIAAGLEITGTLGILLLAKERGLLDSVQPALDRLQLLQFRLSAATRRAVLDLANEL